MLSSFAYGKIKAYFLSRGYRQGVEIHQVNPAYSSVVGRVKFMERYGLTVHQAATLVLARRLLGCLRSHPKSMGMSRRQWRICRLHRTREEASEARVDVLGAVSRQLRPALAAQHRLGKRRRRPSPVFRLFLGRRPAGWLERGPDRCSRVRVPGGAVLNCWGGGAAQTASMADGSL